MLTLEELQQSRINPDVAREAYIQVDRHLNDILEVRKSFEQKAATLLGAYITVSVALFGIGGAIFKDVGMAPKVWPFFAAGLIFIAGASCFIFALKAGSYAGIGSTPEMWLNRGTIDGGENALPAMLAYITYHHHSRIALSLKSNRKKARWISAGIYLGPIAPLVFMAIFFAF
jgi:hypothetical protein